MTTHTTGTGWRSGSICSRRRRTSRGAATRWRGGVGLPAVGADRQSLQIRHRRRQRLADGSIQRALAAPRLSTHVQAPIRGRVLVLLVDRGRVQRHRGPPRKPRRDAVRPCRAHRARSCRRTSGGWDGRSPGRPRPAAAFQCWFSEERHGDVEYNYSREPAAACRRGGRRRRSGGQVRGVVPVPTRRVSRRNRPGLSAFAIRNKARNLHLFHVCARSGRPVGHVPVSDRAQGTQRDRRGLLRFPPATTSTRDEGRHGDPS